MTFSKLPERQIRSHTPSRRAIDTLIRSRFETGANHLCSVPKPISLIGLPRPSSRSCSELRAHCVKSLTEPQTAQQRLVGVLGGRAPSARTGKRMQELVLVQPSRTARSEWAREAAAAAMHREFEERLAE